MLTVVPYLSWEFHSNNNPRKGKSAGSHLLFFTVIIDVLRLSNPLIYFSLAETNILTLLSFLKSQSLSFCSKNKCRFKE